MNLIETLKEHIKMWEWIGMNITTIKPRTINEIKKIYFTNVLKLPLDSVLNLCYICDYFRDCDNCMLGNCFESNSIYNKIVVSIYNGDYKKSSVLAYKMVELALTEEITILEHRKMWNWIADNVIKLQPKKGLQIKIAYFDSEKPTCTLVANDYLCHYVITKHAGDCNYCPIKWGLSDFNVCSEEEFGIFNYCVKNGYYKDASYIAKVIAQLPTKY